MKTLDLQVPWPPSLNRLYRTVAGRVVLSAAGRAYKVALHNTLCEQLPTRVKPLTGRLRVTLWLHAPEKLRGRAWDVMNREKLLCDTLTQLRVWEDDSQIDDFRVRRGDAFDKGQGLLMIEERETPW